MIKDELYPFSPLLSGKTQKKRMGCGRSKPKPGGGTNSPSPKGYLEVTEQAITFRVKPSGAALLILPRDHTVIQLRGQDQLVFAHRSLSRDFVFTALYPRQTMDSFVTHSRFRVDSPL